MSPMFSPKPTVVQCFLCFFFLLSQIKLIYCLFIRAYYISSTWMLNQQITFIDTTLFKKKMHLDNNDLIVKDKLRRRSESLQSGDVHPMLACM